MLARNNRLHEIKILMQESVGHGAPSPKLEKMEEIILLHFSKILACSFLMSLIYNHCQ